MASLILPSFAAAPPRRQPSPTACFRPSCLGGGAAATAISLSQEATLLRRSAEVADLSAGNTAPHPNFGCVVVARGGAVVGEGFLYAQGTRCAVLRAVEAAGELSRGATAYLNMEPGDCCGDRLLVSSLVQAGISRVVVGIRNPLRHLRGKAIQALRGEGVRVDVLGEELQGKPFEEALRSCLLVNAPFLYRAVCRVPFSVLKFAMTLDGKIATNTGHASWISSELSRYRVFDLRGRSDAIVVGGSTVRHDDPQLTARHGGSHVPVRIVMTETLDLPEERNLWDTSVAHTIVATQRGARKDFQQKLASKGVEVVEFDFLNPRVVMEYLYERGYLALLWECGGGLSAPAITSGVIHKIVAFVAPKIIGGLQAPTPVGELGNISMNQAINLHDVSYEQVGPDILVSGYIKPIPDPHSIAPSYGTSVPDQKVIPRGTDVIFFSKTWDEYGAFSSYSPHPLLMTDENGDSIVWPTVEHFFQAHKFIGVACLLARDFIEQIKSAESPEEAARLGRKLQRHYPEMVRPDWEFAKIDAMYQALKCKFSSYPHLNSLLLSTGDSVLVETPPHESFRGGAPEGEEAMNHLGRLLMKLRTEISLRRLQR